MRSRLIGFIPFGRRLLHQQRDQELAARKATAPQGNVEKIAPATVPASRGPDTRRS